MKCFTLLASTSVLFAASLSWLPSFDWWAALSIGGIVTVVAAAVITIAILTPFVAIQGGATILGTCLAVGAIALATGILGGVASGFYWGREGDMKRREQVESIKRVSNQLDIQFEHSSADRAADFQATLVFYEETDLTSRQPTVTTRKVKITGANAAEFYGQVEEEMKRWIAKQVAGDADEQPRRVMIYMRPYPGESVYERLKQIAESNSSRRCIVIKVEGPWKSALPD